MNGVLLGVRIGDTKYYNYCGKRVREIKRKRKKKNGWEELK